MAADPSHVKKAIKLSLNEFGKASKDEWLEKIEAQLKGAPFEKKLVNQTSENISVQPLYSREEENNISGEMPSEFPFTRGHSMDPQKPLTVQNINILSPENFNTIIVNDLQRGQEGIYLQFDQAGQTGQIANLENGMGKEGVSISTSRDMETALKNVDLKKHYLHINCGVTGSAILALLETVVTKSGFDHADIKGSIQFDPHKVLMATGQVTGSIDDYYKDLATLVKRCKNKFINLKMIGVDSRVAVECGASATEELAIMVSSAVAYLKGLSENGLTIDEAAPYFQFSLTSGSNFFMEIAKFRAARRLWAQIVSACDGNPHKAPFVVHVSCQHFNKTIHDPYVNMLRATTETFAAMLGGVNSIHTAPFDEVFSQTDDFSRRIARNTQIVLDEESHANEVIDPAGGSWYIENLTNNLASEAWNLFQKIEGLGGFISALKKGFIQKHIEEVASKRKARIAQRKDGIVGTSLFANIQEELAAHKAPFADDELAQRMKNLSKQADKRNEGEIQELLSFEKGGPYYDKLVQAAQSGATLNELYKAVYKGNGFLKVRPLIPTRASVDYEILRKNVRDFKKIKGRFPAVVLATMGPLRQYQTRADFISNFLTPGGFHPVESGSNSSPEDILAKVKQTEARIVVVCSTDDTYPELIPKILKTIKSYDSTILVFVAGYPKEIIADLKRDGVDGFIHINSNNLQLLQQLQQKTGVVS